MNDLQRKLGLLELGLTMKLASVIIWLAGFIIVAWKPQTVLSVLVFVSVADLVGIFLCASAPIGGLGAMTVRLSMFLNFVGTVASLIFLADSIMPLLKLERFVPMSQKQMLQINNYLILADLAARLLCVIFLVCLASALRDSDSQTKAGISGVMLVMIYVLMSVIAFGFDPKNNVWPLAALIPMVPLGVFYVERYMRCLYDLKQAVSMAQMKATEQANMPDPI
jgi:hypothetical protein